MKLEDEIKQQKFKNEYQKVAINIIYTESWLKGLQLTRFKKHGVSSQQYNILRILRGQYPKPATVNLLIDRMLDKNSNASRLVEKLRLKNYVERTICEDDRRAVNVAITQKGLDLLEKLDSMEDELQKELGSISVAEAKELNRLLDKIRG
ncbi:MAG: MarR family transcriptional regulator [Bacteroidota bacterium]